MPPRIGTISFIPRQELFAEAFRNVYTDRGTRYSCTQSDIDAATHFHGHHSGHYVSANRADDEIAQHNDLRRVPGRSEDAAIHRLLDGLRGCERRRWGPDLVIKAFLDLDRIFFCGRLRGNVRVIWKRNMHRPGVAGYCTRNGASSSSGRCEIWLNADVILLATPRPTPFLEMFATILHEMW